MADRSKTDAADAGFKKLLRDQDGKKAMSEYEAAAAAVRAKTARLKALRLAQEAAEGKATPEEEAPPNAKPAKPIKKSGKPSKKAAGSLSAWLKEREGSGHNN